MTKNNSKKTDFAWLFLATSLKQAMMICLEYISTLTMHLYSLTLRIRLVNPWRITPQAQKVPKVSVYSAKISSMLGYSISKWRHFEGLANPIFCQSRWISDWEADTMVSQRKICQNESEIGYAQLSCEQTGKKL